MTFTDPRQRHYEKRGPIAGLRDRRTSLRSAASAGDRELQVASDPFAIRAPVVVAGPGSSRPDASTVAAAHGNRLVLASPLRFDHQAGEEVAAADARKMSPSYVCRRGGGWLGLFTVFGSIPRAGSEYVAAYRADRLSGPFTLDRNARFPVLSAVNDEFKRSVENPTPVTSDPRAQRCPPDLLPVMRTGSPSR